MKKALNLCPICQKKLIVKEYYCPKCDTTIKGDFEQDKFASLKKEDKDFIEIFVRNRGSIKEIEKELGISYPTVRNKLDQVIAALGHKVEKESSRMEILNMLNEGQISLEEATKLLEEM